VIALTLPFTAVAINRMRITFDPNKNARNIAERSLSFERAADLDWETAVSVEDGRKDYAERRLRVMGRIGPRLHVAVITYRGGAMHVIRDQALCRRIKSTRLLGPMTRTPSGLARISNARGGSGPRPSRPVVSRLRLQRSCEAHLSGVRLEPSCTRPP
jgi:uncharacterized protein